jgi:hypothetical protein
MELVQNKNTAGSGKSGWQEVVYLTGKDLSRHQFR